MIYKGMHTEGGVRGGECVWCSSRLLLSVQGHPDLGGKDSLVDQGHLIVGEAQDSMVDILYRGKGRREDSTCESVS